MKPINPRARHSKRRIKTLFKLALATFLVVEVYFFVDLASMSDSSEKKHIAPDVMEMRRKRFEKNAELENFSGGPGRVQSIVRLSNEEKQRAKEVFEAEGFNYVVSDKLPLDRPVGDIRHEQCRGVVYPKDLPTASVIIIFHNEYWSAILRTAHSVVNRSPPEYLQEVILVDDASTKPDLGEPLDKYLTETWPDGIVKVVRNSERRGLVGARLRGTDEATGDVIVILDAHCEATKGWLEPLLARIKKDRTVMLIPNVDVISAEDLDYHATSSLSLSVGTFRWDLTYSWMSAQRKDQRIRKSRIDPIRTPTMVGCELVADRSFFYEIGAFDDKMVTWGGEHIETSFRVWMCGGSIEYIPCSHVGHVYRSTHPYKISTEPSINSLRAAHVWMDEYFGLFLKLCNNCSQYETDVSERIELRRSLGCKSFSWYLENVIPEKFIPNMHVYGWGKIRNPGSESCLDTMDRDKRFLQLELFYCHVGYTGITQMLSYTKTGKIRNDIGCLDVRREKSEVVLNGPKTLHGFAQTSQDWTYNPATQEFVHKETNKCLDSSEHKIFIKDCDGSYHQKWEMEIMEEDPPPV